jgi:predicted nucleic acid-binding protein
MSDKIFLDTNLWVYLYSDSPKRATIENLIDDQFDNIVISTQVLGECFNVLTRKKLKRVDEAISIINSIATEFEVMAIQKTTVIHGLKLHAHYHFSYYDSLILASALEASCSVLYTEDMQHTQMIETRLQILNPYQTT